MFLNEILMVITYIYITSKLLLVLAFLSLYQWDYSCSGIYRHLAILLRHLARAGYYKSIISRVYGRVSILRHLYYLTNIAF